MIYKEVENFHKVITQERQDSLLLLLSYWFQGRKAIAPLFLLVLRWRIGICKLIYIKKI